MKIATVPIKVAASILGKSEKYIRAGLALGKLPYVTTRKVGKVICHVIDAAAFKVCADCTDADIIRHAEKLGCKLKSEGE